MRSIKGAVKRIDGAVPVADAPANEVLADPSRRMPWFGAVFAIAAIALIPWTLYLGISLPSRQQSANFDVAWAGFDVFLFVALAATAYSIYRRSPWVGMSAGAAAALLITDAWFDVITSPTTAMTVQALFSAAVVELPLAGLCFWLCGHADRLADLRLRILLGRTRRRD